jgi:hypothetical protein
VDIPHMSKHRSPIPLSAFRFPTNIRLCYRRKMTDKSDYEDLIPDFTPVPMQRTRHDGWTPHRQRQFLAALGATGTVDAAASMVGMTRMAAYNLRKRDGAESFSAAWEIAISIGRAMVFDYAMDRAMNGVTTFRLRLGGVVDITHGPDGAMITKMVKSPLPRKRPDLPPYLGR